MSGKPKKAVAPPKQKGEPKKPPASSQKKPAAGAGTSSAQGGQVLQALLLADSFDEFFRPITLETPRCLLPVVNAPLINYTIENLAANGVEEIFIFCCSHADLIEAHVNKFVASGRLPDVVLRCIVSKNSLSVGDALREVHQMGVLRDDFVLVYGDVVSNFKLSRLVQEHAQRRQKDKQAIMTLLLAPCRNMRTPALRTPNPSPTMLEAASVHAASAPAAASQPAALDRATASGAVEQKAEESDFEDDYDESDETEQPHASDDDDNEDDDDAFDDEDEGDELSEKVSAVRRRGGDGTARRLVALDAESGQLLLYVDSSTSGAAANKNELVEMDMSVFEKRNRLVFRHDLEEVGVAVCASDVLFQFVDNFDYQNVPQFVRGVVNEEILSCRVYALVDSAPASYSSRVSSLRRYQHVSWDILQRWAHPFTPDTNLVTPGHADANYSFVRDVRGGPGVYLQRPVHLARSAIVSGAAALSHPEVRKYTQQEPLSAVASAVGEQTRIGEGSVVFASCIGRNCQIGQNVVIICAHVWDGVHVGDGSVIVGSLVASNVRLGAHSYVRQGAVVSYGVSVPPGTVVPPLAKICSASVAPRARAAGVPLKPFQSLADSVRQLAAPAIPLNELVLGWEPQLQQGGGVAGASSVNTPQPGRHGGGKTALRDSDDDDDDDSDEAGTGARIDDADDNDDVDADYSFSTSPAAKKAGPASSTSSSKTASTAAKASASSAKASKKTGKRTGGGGGGGGDFSTSEDEGDGDDDGDRNEVSDIEKFRQEVAQTVMRAVNESHKMDTLVLEVNSLKYAYDASFLESAGSIFEGMMNTLPAQLTAKPLASLLAKWGPIFSKFLMDKEEQVEFIFKIQEFCERDGNDRFAKLFQNVLHALYDADVLDEEAIFAWADEQQQSGEDLRFLNQCKKLIDWLRADESEDSE